ncbi:glycosyl hydrolase family 28-related protein [Neolewinella persica]|uniref:glycosyl hydrolase family 28-related protein n=1 Tax=Neolewinella persica TaxID=70998 RepID=UPI0003727DEE|nr:glycosyl hydrolase family 28-related protein [Neolewinella persica]
MKPVLFLFFLFTASLSAQEWRSSLYSEAWTAPTVTDSFYTNSFIQDFSYAGYHRGEIPIPDITENIVDVTMSPYNADPTGTEDATAAIQAAIDQVQTDGGGVIFLPAGTYLLSVTEDRSEALWISADNVVLRGAGTDQTFLYNTTMEMRQKQIIRIEEDNGGWNWDRLPDVSDRISITTDLTGPTTNIPVSNPELFTVGDEVLIRSLMTDGWVRDHNEAPDWLNFQDRLDGFMNYRVVTEVTPDAIVVDAPIRYAFMMRDGAMVYASRSNMLSEVGLEGFSIGNKEIVAAAPSDWHEGDGTLDNSGHSRVGKPAYNLHAGSAIKIERAQNSWVRDVNSYQHPDNIFGTHILSNGIKLEMSSRVTLDNVSMRFSQYGGGGGNGYGFRIESNDCLLINCSSEAMRHGFVLARIWSSGNVFHRVTDSNTGTCTANEQAPFKTGSSGSDFHFWFSPSNLIDQMTVDRSYYSAVHRRGVSASATQPGHNAVTAHSVFWNFTANDAPNGYGIRTSQTRDGYVMGTQGNSPGVNNKPTDPVNLLNLDISGDNPAFRYDFGGLRTMPFDLVEGKGIGALLRPQSLYLDQLDRRMNPVNTPNIPGQSFTLRAFPNPSQDGYFNLSEAQEWAVYSLAGRLIGKGRGASVDLRRQPPGLYVLRAGRQVIKLVR